VLVFNQYYWPGVEATANLLTELCEALADEYEVTVVTGRLLGYEDEPDYERRNGVEIVRVRSTAFDRAPLHRRAANYFTYLSRALARGLLADRPDAVLCMTDPPMVGDVALLVARRYRVPLLVISQDVFPEIAVELRRLTNPVLVGLLQVLTRFYLRRADRIVAIGETMGRRLAHKGVESERMRVIPNWTDTRVLEPRPRDNAWAQENGLVGRFVLMHSGNVGHAQDLDTLVRAATFLRDLDDLRIVVIGTGARHAELVALAERLEVEPVFLPYQPKARLAESLSAADVHLVGLGRGLSGFVVPSRMNGILSVGRPVIVTADEESETARITREIECGVVAPPGRPELLAQAIRSAHDGELDLAEMGRRARAYALAEADRDVAIGRYRAVLGELVRHEGPSGNRR
jgi:glycosyltransferase involved in cell wall biosynthesis